jgi:hypothetical protein
MDEKSAVLRANLATKLALQNARRRDLRKNDVNHEIKLEKRRSSTAARKVLSVSTDKRKTDPNDESRSHDEKERNKVTRALRKEEEVREKEKTKAAALKALWAKVRLLRG